MFSLHGRPNGVTHLQSYDSILGFTVLLEQELQPVSGEDVLLTAAQDGEHRTENIMTGCIYLLTIKNGRILKRQTNKQTKETDTEDSVRPYHSCVALTSWVSPFSALTGQILYLNTDGFSDDFFFLLLGLTKHYKGSKKWKKDRWIVFCFVLCKRDLLVSTNPLGVVLGDLGETGVVSSSLSLMMMESPSIWCGAWPFRAPLEWGDMTSSTWQGCLEGHRIRL